MDNTRALSILNLNIQWDGKNTFKCNKHLTKTNHENFFRVKYIIEFQPVNLGLLANLFIQGKVGYYFIGSMKGHRPEAKDYRQSILGSKFLFQ